MVISVKYRVGFDRLIFEETTIALKVFSIVLSEVCLLVLSDQWGNPLKP